MVCTCRWTSSGYFYSLWTNIPNCQESGGPPCAELHREGHNLPSESPCILFQGPSGNNAFVLMCGLQRKGGKSLGSGIVSVSSCCMSDKLKGYRYEHGKILGKQGVKTKQQMSLSTQKCAVVFFYKCEKERETYTKYPLDGQGNIYCPCQTVPQIFLSSLLPSFDESLKGCWWSSKGRVKHVREEGRRREGKRKVNE